MKTSFHLLALSYLVFSSITVGAQEPAGIKGYIAWTDPASSEKHIVYGRKSSTDNTLVDVDHNPGLFLTFTGAGTNPATQQRYLNISESVYEGQTPGYGEWVDATGHVVPPTSTSRVAFRYKLIFHFDLSMTAAQAPVQEDKTSIRYNPNFWHFSKVEAFSAYNTAAGNPIVLESAFLPPTIVRSSDHTFTRPMRTSAFPDLPDFDR